MMLPDVSFSGFMGVARLVATCLVGWEPDIHFVERRIHQKELFHRWYMKYQNYLQIMGLSRRQLGRFFGSLWGGGNYVFMISSGCCTELSSDMLLLLFDRYLQIFFVDFFTLVVLFLISHLINVMFKICSRQLLQLFGWICFQRQSCLKLSTCVGFFCCRNDVMHLWGRMTWCVMGKYHYYCIQRCLLLFVFSLVGLGRAWARGVKGCLGSEIWPNRLSSHMDFLRIYLVGLLSKYQPSYLNCSHGSHTVQTRTRESLNPTWHASVAGGSWWCSNLPLHPWLPLRLGAACAARF